MTEEWKTSTKAYETDKVIGYEIGFFSTLGEARRVKAEIQDRFGVEVVADIRLVGLVPKKTLRKKGVTGN